MNQFRTMIGLIGGMSMYVLKLPKEIPKEIWKMDETNFEKITGIETTINTTEETDIVDQVSKKKKTKPVKFIQENLNIEMSHDRNISELARSLLSKNIKSNTKMLSYNEINQLWENFDEKAFNKPLANGNIAYPTLSPEFSTRINDELDSRIEIPYDIDITQIEQCLKSLVDGKPLPVRENILKSSNSLITHSRKKNKEKEEKEESVEKKQLKKYGSEKYSRKKTKKDKKSSREAKKEEKEIEEEESENSYEQYGYEISHNAHAKRESAYENQQSAHTNRQHVNGNGNDFNWDNTFNYSKNKEYFDHWYHNYQMSTKVNILSHYYYKYMNE